MVPPSSPPRYRHTQRGVLMVGVSLAAAGFVFYYLLNSGPAWLWAVLAVLAAVGIVFSSLTVTIDATRLMAAFAPGWPRLAVPLDDIAEALVVRNPWYYGWGIRLTPRGTLYNVSGLDAVEVRRKNGKTLRIGTDEPEILQQALARAIGQETAHSRQPGAAFPG